METENLVSFLDYYWFEVEILKSERQRSNCESNPVQELPKPSLTTISTKRSMDENIESEVNFSSESSNNSSVSPSSVLVLERGGEKKMKAERGFSKSLSDLEFEELKGFMDLGFVFSQEDKGSEFLTTILPGLQLLEEEDKQVGNIRRKSVNGSSGISRPYLSEAWKVSEMNKMRRRKRENLPLIMSSDKIHMKDYLKSWAHNVASSVK